MESDGDRIFRDENQETGDRQAELLHPHDDFAPRGMSRFQVSAITSPRQTLQLPKNPHFTSVTGFQTT